MSNTRSQKTVKVFFIGIVFALVSFYGCKSKSSNPTAPVSPNLNSSLLITNGTAPYISPDGNGLLYKRDSSWYYHHAGADIQVISSVNPTSAIRWFTDNTHVVFSVSGQLGSTTNGIYLEYLPTDSLINLHQSGRDPIPWTHGTVTDSVVFEETNPLTGTGLYTYAIRTETITRVGFGLVGTNPEISPDGNVIVYLGGSVATSPCIARANNNWTERILSSNDSYHIVFASDDYIYFDSYSSSGLEIFRYSNITATDSVFVSNAGHPVGSASGAVAYQSITNNSTELMLYRNQTVYTVSNNISSYSLTADGRVVYEKNGSIWITD